VRSSHGFLPVFLSSFQILIDRHPSLRTIYDDEGGEPYQAVQMEAPLDYMHVPVSVA
jgi:hypothetical protein